MYTLCIYAFFIFLWIIYLIIVHGIFLLLLFISFGVNTRAYLHANKHTHIRTHEISFCIYTHTCTHTYTDYIFLKGTKFAATFHEGKIKHYILNISLSFSFYCFAFSFTTCITHSLFSMYCSFLRTF